MKFKFNKKLIPIGITSFLVIAAAICFYYFIFKNDIISYKIKNFFYILSPVVYGIIFSYLLTPVVNFIEKKIIIPILVHRKKSLTVKSRKYMRWFSVSITIIIVIALIYAFASILVPNISKSIITISYQFPYYITNFTSWSYKFMEDNPDLYRFMISMVDRYSIELNAYLDNTLVPQAQEILKQISLSLINVLITLWNFVLGIIISFYVLFNKELFAGQAKKITYAFLKTERANTLIKDIRFASQTFIGFISGKIVDSLIIGVLCFIGLSILRMPYAILVSVIVGITNIIPFFGPYLGAIPSALLILLVNPLKCLYFIIFIIILQQIDGNVIGPKILGQSTGLSSFWVIFSITIFGGYWGVPGMIVGVPFFAVIYALSRRWIDHFLKKKGLSLQTIDYISVDKIEDKQFIPLQEPIPKEHHRFSKEAAVVSDAETPVESNSESDGDKNES